MRVLVTSQQSASWFLNYTEGVSVRDKLNGLATQNVTEEKVLMKQT